MSVSYRSRQVGDVNVFHRDAGAQHALIVLLLREPTPENREAFRAALPPAAIENWRHGAGTRREQVSPDGYLLAIALMSWPGAEEIQLDVTPDYRANLESHAGSQAYFRHHQPSLLAVWAALIRRSSPWARTPTSATYPTPRSISWMQAAWRWRPMRRRSPGSSKPV